MSIIISQMIEIIQKLVVLMTLQASLLSPAIADLPLGGTEPLGAPQETLQQKFDKAPQEIKTKYSLVGASLVKNEIKNPELDKYKNEPKDEISVTIGSETAFKPDIELKRWNECSFKIKPKGLDLVAEKDKTLSFEGEKIKFKTPKMDFEMYDYTEGEGGYKYIWYLNEKPASNKIEFDIESSGLNFYRQSPLTEEYQNGYNEQFGKEIIVTETQVKDLDGNVLVERPENVVNSYAVYHSTKGGMVDAYGKDYKVGKAFHIFRPKLIDANGLEAWGNLHIENGIYSVEIPQDFLNKAVYPIKSNDKFGYETMGTGISLFCNNRPMGTQYAIPADGTVSKLTIGVNSNASGNRAGGAIYNTSNPHSLIANAGTGAAVTVPGGTTDVTGWFDIVFSSQPSLTTGNYYLVISADDYTTDATIIYAQGDTVASNPAFYTATSDFDAGWAATLTNSSTYTDRKWSIYATYTPAAPPATAGRGGRNPVIIIVQ